MVERIGASGWRVGVSGDGVLFSLGVRTPEGREVEVVLGTVDSSALLADLLADVAEVHRALPPRTFAPGSGPDHPRARPVRPLAARIEPGGILALDFGGTVLRVAVDPGELRAMLDRA